MNVTFATVDIHSLVLPESWVVTQYAMIVTMMVYIVVQIASAAERSSWKDLTTVEAFPYD